MLLLRAPAALKTAQQELPLWAAGSGGLLAWGWALIVNLQRLSSLILLIPPLFSAPGTVKAKSTFPQVKLKFSRALAWAAMQLAAQLRAGMQQPGILVALLLAEASGAPGNMSLTCASDGPWCAPQR